MNKQEQNFQKRLAIWQLLGTAIATSGAVLFAYGLSLLLFSSELGIDSLQASNEIQENLEIFSKISSNGGFVYLITGLILLFGGPLLITFVIVKEKVKEKTKFSKSSKLQVLFDEMYDGKDIELQKQGYDAYSVKKIRLTGEPLRYDHSVLKYVEENKMILITADPENYGGCIENNMPCIKLGQNPSIDEIIKELESLK